MGTKSKVADYLTKRGWIRVKEESEVRGGITQLIVYWRSLRLGGELYSTGRAEREQRKMERELSQKIKTCSLCGKEYTGFFCKEHFSSGKETSPAIDCTEKQRTSA